MRAHRSSCAADGGPDGPQPSRVVGGRFYLAPRDAPQRSNHGLVRMSSKHSRSVIRLPRTIHWSLCRRAQMFQEFGPKYPSLAKAISKNGERAFGPGQASLAMNWRYAPCHLVEKSTT